MKCGVPPEAVMRTPEMSMFFIYIIQSEKTNRYYVGYTGNIDQRLEKHNAGGVNSTKHVIPWKLKYTEEFTNKVDAWKRERQIKSYKGGKAFKLLLGEVA